MIYADTSFLLAMRVPSDNFHEAALAFYEANQENVWLGSPWHRVEIFNSLRQLARHPEAKRRITVTEARSLIRRIETDVRLGYFTHLEADWRDVLRTANELSIAHGFDLPCRAPDLLHVAYANELASEQFVSFDEEQLNLARASGWRTKLPAT
jgi:predicted nucleic acid-binding protein